MISDPGAQLTRVCVPCPKVRPPSVIFRSPRPLTPARAAPRNALTTFKFNCTPEILLPLTPLSQTPFNQHHHHRPPLPLFTPLPNKHTGDGYMIRSHSYMPSETGIATFQKPLLCRPSRQVASLFPDMPSNPLPTLAKGMHIIQACLRVLPFPPPTLRPSHPGSGK